MIRFVHPEYLHLLGVIPVLAVMVWIEHRWRLRAMRSWAAQNLWDAALPHRAPGRVLGRRLLTVAALALGVTALAGPQVGTRLVEVKREGSDIVIALDLSNSMLAEDLTPNRFLRARHEITRFLSQLHGDRVALVTFAGTAFVQVPLTLDYSAVVTLMNSLDPSLMPLPGTSLAEAIVQARRAFRAESKAQKVLVLVTDGEDHEGGALEQAKEAAREGIVIFTVGAATPNGAPIPVKDERGRVIGYKKERSGQTVVSRLGEDDLVAVARATGGEFYRMGQPGTAFAPILKRITGMDKEEFETRRFTDYEDRFQYLLAAALVLLAAAEVIPPGRRRTLSAGTSVLALLLVLQSNPALAGAREQARKGVKLYHQNEYDRALAEFLAGLEMAPDRRELKYDVGAAQYKLQDYGNAARAFADAAAEKSKLAADAWFNLGNALLKGGKPQEAVAAYKNALKINHQDRDAKYNLELALRMMQMQRAQNSDQSSERGEQQPSPQQSQGAPARPDSSMTPPDSTSPEPQPPPTEMTREEALQLLQAMESDEQQAQREKMARQYGQPRPVTKDW